MFKQKTKDSHYAETILKTFGNGDFDNFLSLPQEICSGVA